MLIRALSTLALCAALHVSCGGPQSVHPQCRDSYDECVNNCAARCDQGSTSEGPSIGSDYESYTWEPECQECSDRCDRIAEQCAERLAPAE